MGSGRRALGVDQGDLRRPGRGHRSNLHQVWGAGHRARCWRRLSSGANAISGGVIILRLDRLNQIRRIDPLERLVAVVQAIVINDELRTAAAEQGTVVSAGSASSPWSTIGGNIATNAGGVCCVKYGVTKDYVLALEVVTGTGELVRLGRATAKGVAGYDLVALMVGSEGTLSIITEATVRLKRCRPRPGQSSATSARSSMPVKRRGQSREPTSTSALELIDCCCLAVDKWKNMGLSLKPTWCYWAGSMTRARPARTAPIRCSHALKAPEQPGRRGRVMRREADALFAARRLAYRIGAIGSGAH